MSDQAQQIDFQTLFTPGMFEVYELDQQVTGKRKGTEMTTGISPSAGGNLAHTATNDNRFEQLIELSTTLGVAAGQGEDVQIKHLLAVTQSAFEGVIDNTVDKHGTGLDDATKITEAYWKARNKNVVFNPKAGNQRKTISCIRQCITLGGWSKGGPGEPIGMINRAMTQYQSLRKNPTTAKKLIDAANYLILIARKMKRNDVILDLHDLGDLALKKDPDVATVEDVLDGMRRTLTKLKDGKHPAGGCGGTNVETAIKAINRELKAIADGKRTQDVAEAAADIVAAAEVQAKVEDKAGVAAPVAADSQ